MTRYALISQSTDLRAPETKISFTTSRKKALLFKSQGGKFTHGDPEGSKNWHHTFNYAIQLNPGWRKPTRKWLEEKARKESSRDYPRFSHDILANLCFNNGIELEVV
jgi:hypothetical protein